jgi:hypothetical protein
MKKDKFEYTIEGNRKAQEYLKQEGMFSKRAAALDGYQQVHIANSLYEQMNTPLKSKSNGTVTGGK